MMRQRETMYLIGGLIVGLIVGMLLAGAAGLNLMGTATDEDDNGNVAVEEDVEYEYYLITLDELREWMQTEEPAEVDPENPLFNADLTATEDFYAAFASAEELDQQTVSLLSGVHQRMAGEAVGDNLVVCLALNDDPYSMTGPLLYVYMQVPQDMEADVAESWEATTVLEDSLVWSTRCYNESE